MHMDITTLAAAQQSVKALFGLAKIATAATVDHELKARLIEIQSGILDAQAKLGDAQAERLVLLDELGELREKLRRHESAQAALGDYKLNEVEPGKYLYKYTGESQGDVAHFACPPCHNSGAISVLQTSQTGTRQSIYRCSKCKFHIYVGPSDPPAPPPRRSEWRSF